MLKQNVHQHQKKDNGKKSTQKIQKAKQKPKWEGKTQETQGETPGGQHPKCNSGQK